MIRGKWERALRDPDRRPDSLSGTDLGVAFALATYAENDGTEARPSETTLADASGRSRSTVQSSLRSLEEAKVIVGKRVSRREPVVWTLTEWPDSRATDTDGELTDTRATHEGERPDSEATQLTGSRATELTDPQPSGPTDEPSGPIDGPEWPEARAQQVVDRSFRQNNMADGPAVTATVEVEGFDTPFPTRTRGMLITDAILDWAVLEKVSQNSPPRQARQRADAALKTVLLVLGDAKDATVPTVGVCGDYLGDSSGQQVSGKAWGILQALVRDFGGLETVGALAEGTTRGAGFDEADPSEALCRYAAGVLRARDAA